MPAIDNFARYGDASTASLENGAAVTPSDATDLAFVTRAVWVGGEGDLHVTMKRGATITIPNLHRGWHALRVSRIWATGTTATDVVAFE